MIRPFQPADLKPVAEIWLSANLQAHPFIPARYWQENLASVKDQLMTAELYVWINAATGALLGFIGLRGDYIAGLFVRQDARSRGLGRELLNHAKAQKGALSLRVYEKNRRALQFYRREGFVLQRYGVDADTGEREMILIFQP